jgi:hypothetical protein
VAAVGGARGRASCAVPSCPAVVLRPQGRTGAGATAPLAAAAALRGAPRIARGRRPLGLQAERELRLVERQAVG